MQNKDDIRGQINRSKEENERLASTINPSTCLCKIDIISAETIDKVTVRNAHEKHPT